MPRRLRAHYPGGFYHVTLRGNHQRAIFFTDGNRVLLNRIVARAITMYGTRVHAYCWMGNHIHLLLEAGIEPIGHPMRNIASEYARAMQINLQTTGHFFERRYHATLVDTDSYLLGVIRYIHRNPVEAGLTDQPASYPWSSHHAYVGARHEPWVTTEFGLRAFAEDRVAAIAAYQAFVGCPSDEPWIAEMASNGGEIEVLGSDEFRARVAPQIRLPERQTLEQLIEEACRRFVVEIDRLSSPIHDPYLAKVRAWVGAQARQRGVATLSAVARALNRDEATLRYAIRRYASEIE